jgi:hypothetical protein
MKNLNLLLLIFSTSTIFCSCTITKRHFGNGYHIEWNRKIKERDSQKELTKIQPAENDLVSENKSDVDSLVLIEVMETQNEPAIDGVQVQQVSEKILQPEQRTQSTEIQTIKKPFKFDQKNPENEELPKRRMHPLTWAIWGAWSVGIVFIFFVTFYAEALIGVAVFFLLAMIFAFFIIHSLRKHPEKYRLKKLSYGFVIPAIIFGGIVLAGLGLFLLMSLA